MMVIPYMRDVGLRYTVWYKWFRLVYQERLRGRSVRSRKNKYGKKDTGRGTWVLG